MRNLRRRVDSKTKKSDFFKWSVGKYIEETRRIN